MSFIGPAPVYLSGSPRQRDQLLALRERLPEPLTSTARWLDGDPALSPSAQFDAGPAAVRAASRRRLLDIRRSRLVIALADESRSVVTSTEIGAALALGIPVIVVGAPVHSLDSAPGLCLAADVDQAVAAASRWAER